MRNKVWAFSLVLTLVVLPYFIGPVPTTPKYSIAWPNVPAALPELQAYIEQTEDSLPVREDNQARILWHRSTPKAPPKVTEYSFVYLHGFAGSYRDGYPLNVQVADTFEANMYLARWAYHGLKPPTSLQHFSPETAWESAKEALAIGRRIGRKVIIMSTSTGGTLALKLAATYPDSVFALINISPNIQDDAFGASLLNSPWGYEIARLVSLGEHRRIRHREAMAARYWDTLYPADALINLQVLVETTMQPKTFEEVACPVLTLYYYKNFLEEDGHVEVDIYPEVHQAFSTPDSLHKLIALDKPGTHFIGSSIKSKDWRTARKEIIQFCRQTLGMNKEPDTVPL